MHRADPEWVRLYGDGNARPTVEAYADFRCDGANAVGTPAIPAASHEDDDDDSSEVPKLPPVKGSGSTKRKPKKRRKKRSNRKPGETVWVKLPPISKKRS